MSRAALVGAIRPFAPNRRLTQSAVVLIDGLADLFGIPPDDERRISDAGLNIIKAFEGLRLTAYKCPADVWTIGYGSTGPHVKPGLTITEAEAEALLRKDVARFERGVADMAPKTTEGQFDALVSLGFNIGLEALRGSTLIKLHNGGDYAGAARQFVRWNRAEGKVLAGLTRRRMTEAAIYKDGPA